MRQQLVNSVYNLVERLSQSDLNNGIHSFQNVIPAKFKVAGLYVVLDPNSTVEIGNFQRIVRIGITKGENSRLAFHQNGNKENSIFRKHVQRALSASQSQVNNVHVSQYIHSLNYVFLPVVNSELLHLFEKTLIAILSNTIYPSYFPAQKDWLGFSEGININPSIASSQLWNVHHTQTFNPDNFQHYQNVIIQLNDLIGEIN